MSNPADRPEQLEVGAGWGFARTTSGEDPLAVVTDASNCAAVPAHRFVTATPDGPLAARARLARRARRLSWVSLAWLGVEGGLGVAAGALASSVALVAFGLDGGIEALASVVVIWRFAASRTASGAAERRAQQVVAVSFFLLAPYVTAEALAALLAGERPETSWLGVTLAAGSLLICPWLGAAKRRVGERLGSDATKGEGRQNQLCALLAAAVLVGLGANALFGLWWFDPAVALGIAAASLVLGRRSWNGGDCGCGGCAPPHGAPPGVALGAAGSESDGTCADRDGSTAPGRASDPSAL